MPTPDAKPVPIAVIGTGYRARLLQRVATRLPGRFEITGLLTRGPADETGRVTRDLEELLSRKPSFVIVAVPPAVAVEVVKELVQRQVRVLVETPPAPDRESLEDVWARVGEGGLVQVAEQYPRHPMTAARIAAVQGGLIGTVSSVAVSFTQTYHAMAVARAVLGVEDGAAEVRATTRAAPLVAPFGRAGWTGDAEPHQTTTTLATIDFGESMAVYDFTDGQTRNPLRGARFLARGSLGEIAGERVTRLAQRDVVVESDLLRRDLGMHHDFEDRELVQISLDGDILWRNDFMGAGLSDEELAIADLLTATAAWSLGEGSAPYPLAEAAQDQLLGLAIGRAASTGTSIHTPAGMWRS